MITYTTPTITMRFPQTVDLASATAVLISLKQDNTLIKKEAEITGQTAEIELTQEESGMFHEGMASARANIIYPNGKRAATFKRQVKIEENDIDEVIE